MNPENNLPVKQEELPSLEETIRTLCKRVLERIGQG